ncbi:hypothetical protein [Pantanalinema sp. GBBB05]|uniref:hypothetical protein n=1 Tax=Pantanalinema sp. GBBB05 TaxID=2604139 RepID=UPI003D816D18
MALGTLVLGGITVGPALMIGGFVLGSQGEKALTEARKYEAKVKTEIAKLNVFNEFLGQVQRRISELSDLIKALDARAVEGLEELECKPFSRERDARKFQQVALIIKSLSEIMKTPVLDAEGKLNPVTAIVREKYRTV